MLSSSDPPRSDRPAARAAPALALRWLSQARRVLIAVQLLLLGLAFFAGTQLPFALLLAICGLLLGLDLAAAPERPERWVGWYAGLDLLALTALLLLSGGAQSPMQAFYLVEVALLAVVLPARAAWAATAATVALQAAATLNALPIPERDGGHHHEGHLIGHIIAFDLAALAITAFVGRLSAQLRDWEAALRSAEAAQADHARLAALGTLAAGTAHALGTPLGAIELLAEELAAPGASRETHAELVAQLRRCRAILDRMLAGAKGSGGQTPGVCREITGWISAWRQAQGGAARLEADPAGDLAADPAVSGEAAGWREALWTILDNARTAGDPISVRVESGPEAVCLIVEDSGPPVPPEQLARAGQPFFSAWPRRNGTGLGLYGARTFAQAAGGDLLLEARPGGGARVTLVMPTVSLDPDRPDQAGSDRDPG